jgi:hypothetical protein
MEFRRTNFPKKHPIRIELENYVIAWNKYLKDVVKSMNIIILLRNAHPMYRADFAYKLRDAGLIKPEQVSEFIKPVNFIR